MPEKKEIVINTGPILALIAATGDLNILQRLYTRVYVPFEVCSEIACPGADGFGVREFQRDKWLTKVEQPTTIPLMLKNSLDTGEASVIQFALGRHIETVCIDEKVGRRFARLSGLLLTGSLGILIAAKRSGENINLQEAIRNTRRKGIWISEDLAANVARIENGH